ncbi:Trp biosynthesis-associated membrane protein [Arthrobacter crystallopoietes]|uniref:Trp biosynthesis-associated membrane protein n=1 Tax=Crystallibacter crystallopoietes TaxID=37928 RepID=UPI00111126F1|nr:Trp biosynthesis-associated membrane protein [Arthrobacter crystallopoietes]
MAERTELKPPSRWQRKSTVVMASILASLAAFGATTQTWLNVRLPQSTVQTPDLSVAGSEAAIAVTALALVGLAAALAASIAGRIARIVIAVLLALAGAGIALSSYQVIADPAAAASTAIGEATGQVGQAAEISSTMFPVLALVAGLLMAACAVWLVLAGRRWQANRKYTSATARQADGSPSDRGGPVDEIDSWDQLSRGTDPTD